MAVKKASAKKPVKKAVAKKTVAKKVAKKAVAKPAKKAVAKKVAKKAPAKKVAKKSAVKAVATKPAAKKAVSKKSVVKKSAAKKSAPKKSSVKKSAAKKQVLKFDVPEAPVIVRPSRLEVVSTPASPPSLASNLGVSSAKGAPKSNGPSGRVVAAVAVGIIILIAIVWGRSGHESDDGAVKPSTTATITTDPSTSSTPSDTPSATPSDTPSETSAALATHDAPQGIVAHYTKTGATIFWNAPAATDGLTGYTVEISIGGGAWKTISTVPATQLTQDVMKDSAESWTSFKVSSVYSDAVTTPGKVFGLPGTFS